MPFAHLLRHLSRQGRNFQNVSSPKGISPESLIVVLHDHGRVDDTIRSQLQNTNREEILAIEKRVKRLLDMCLVFMAWIMFALNSFDRSSLGNARVMGLQQDLDMDSNQYGLSMMLLFIAYVMAQLPSNYYLARGRPSIYLPGVMVLWGGVCTATAFVKTPSQLYAVRFILGLLEAPFCAGCLFLISSWYTRTELGLRSAIILSAPMTANAFSGLVAFGIYDTIDGAKGLEGWRWLFIVGGASTVFIAGVAFYVLPDFPFNTRYLSDKERAVAQLRLIADGVQVAERDNSRWQGLVMAVRSWLVWIFAGMFLLLSIGASVHNFFPSVVNTLGFSRNTTLWMTAPPYLIAVVVTIANSLFADRHRNASFHVIGPAALATLGFLLFLLDQTSTRRGVWIRYAAALLMVVGAHSGYPVVLSWAQKTIRQPKEMRACAIAIISASGSISQIITSELYPNRWAPKYVQSMSLNTSCALGAIILATFMRIMLRRRNKRLDQEAATTTAFQDIPGSDTARQTMELSSWRYIT
ncbi:MFS transporter [Fonsecaea pedrosoi]|nr:MFS transporter [Fonsecaea pedrosoi]